MNGIWIDGRDEAIESRAQAAGLHVCAQTDAVMLPFEKTLIVQPETAVPWDLLPAAWHFLDRWDAAVPLWRYGETAADVGEAEERHITREIVRDLRVLLHSTELLFLRRNEAGQALLAAWREEMAHGEHQRLAFLRALYRVKPRLCVLPVTWLAPVRQASHQAMRRGRVLSPNAGNPLVSIELEPGRFVKIHAGDEARVRAAFEQQRAGR